MNSGSNGSDGAFNPTIDTVINMADHPTGICHYTSVNISNGVTVTFIPNANNTPVVWLVQTGCTINGNVSVAGQSSPTTGIAGVGGPGGYRGGNGGPTGNSGLGRSAGSPLVLRRLFDELATGYYDLSNAFALRRLDLDRRIHQIVPITRHVKDVEAL